MTHEYTTLLGGTILPGGGQPEATAIAWAEGTVLALGTDKEVRAISRGDSHFVDLAGAYVVPLGATDEPTWPTDAVLEVGSPADLAILATDPRNGVENVRVIAVVRGGHAISGKLSPPTAGP